MIDACVLLFAPLPLLAEPFESTVSCLFLAMLRIELCNLRDLKLCNGEDLSANSGLFSAFSGIVSLCVILLRLPVARMTSESVSLISVSFLSAASGVVSRLNIPLSCL